MKYFVDVVQTHGFSSAAKRNYVSETAVSTAVKHLEDDLRCAIDQPHTDFIIPHLAGEFFYQRAIKVLDAYGEIWRHPEQEPDAMLRVHFFQGLADEAAAFAQQLQTKQLSFDEEPFTDAFTRLLAHDYDILIGFELAFIGNAKLQTFPLRKVGFDVLCNTEELAEQPLKTPQRFQQQSKLYLQHWKSSGIADIQAAMLKKYGNSKVGATRRSRR
jgi:DNA-binding transcriptional LysR family regulator